MTLSEEVQATDLGEGELPESKVLDHLGLVAGGVPRTGDWRPNRRADRPGLRGAGGLGRSSGEGDGSKRIWVCPAAAVSRERSGSDIVLSHRTGPAGWTCALRV